jgi:hypothetical protein
VVYIMKECGGIAIPAHPFRESVHGKALEEGREWVAGVEIIEQFNGANTEVQDAKASAIVARDGLRGIGGSDAHYVNWFLKCATVFDRHVETMQALVEELYAGRFTPIRLPQPADGCDGRVLGPPDERRHTLRAPRRHFPPHLHPHSVGEGRGEGFLRPSFPAPSLGEREP